MSTTASIFRSLPSEVTIVSKQWPLGVQTYHKKTISITDHDWNVIAICNDTPTRMKLTLLMWSMDIDQAPLNHPISTKNPVDHGILQCKWHHILEIGHKCKSIIDVDESREKRGFIAPEMAEADKTSHLIAITSVNLQDSSNR